MWYQINHLSNSASHQKLHYSESDTVFGYLKTVWWSDNAYARMSILGSFSSSFSNVIVIDIQNEDG